MQIWRLATPKQRCIVECNCAAVALPKITEVQMSNAVTVFETVAIVSCRNGIGTRLSPVNINVTLDLIIQIIF